MTNAELELLVSQLQQEYNNKQLKLESGAQEIAYLAETFTPDNNGSMPFCMFAKRTTGQNSAVIGDLATGLSVSSTIFSGAGPVGEFFHDYKTYHKGTTNIPMLAYGQPGFDFLSNGFYIIHLGIEWHNGGDSQTFTRDSLPSFFVMTVEGGIITSLLIYTAIRARIQSSELTPLLTN